MIEITKGMLVNPDAIDLVESDHIGLTKVLFRSGDWINIHVPYDDVRALLLTASPDPR